MTEPTNETINKVLADFSPCRKYRYTLWRTWLEPLVAQHTIRYVNFICLNPSTADEIQDDPTIRRCVRFAKDWGYEAMCVTNLFAYRATDPREMKGQSNPVGDENDKWLCRIARDADEVIAAWGSHGQFLGRSEEVMKFLPVRPKYLRMGAKEPWHPLYLPARLEPISWL